MLGRACPAACAVTIALLADAYANGFHAYFLLGARVSFSLSQNPDGLGVIGDPSLPPT
jgi:hypothetical protein